MGLIKSPKITSEYLLSQIDEAAIFAAYYGDFSLNKSYNSVFRKDENASCGFYISQSGRLIYNDLRSSEKLDCFAFIAKMYNIEYKDALIKVACDFGLIPCEGIPKFEKSTITKAQLQAEEIKHETKIEIIPDSWSESYINFWKQFSITKDELISAEVYPVKKLFINDKIIPNYAKNVRFALLNRFEDKLYKKIYNPYATDKKFKWLSNIPLYLPFGFGQLPFKDNRLIITKAQKDRIIFKKYFTDVIGLQNESPAALRDKTIDWLKKRYKTIYINMDLDEAGQNAVAYYKEKGFIPLMLPDVIYKTKGIKDCADFVKEFGIERFEKFLKHNNL